MRAMLLLALLAALLWLATQLDGCAVVTHVLGGCS